MPGAKPRSACVSKNNRQKIKKISLLMILHIWVCIQVYKCFLKQFFKRQVENYFLAEDTS